MNVEAFFRSLRGINDRINKQIMTLSELRASLGVRAVAFNENKVQTSPTQDTLTDTISAIIELESEIDELTDEFINKKRRCKEMLSVLPENMQIVMGLYYLDFCPMSEVASLTNQSQRWCFALKEKSLMILEDKFT